MYLRFILAFIVLAGLALFFARALKMRIGEGMVPAAALVVFTMYVSGLAHAFTVGVGLLTVMGAAGWILHLYLWNKARTAGAEPDKSTETGKGGGVISAAAKMNGAGRLVRTPYLILSFLLMIFFMIVYYREFIQRIDELHLWAPNIRFMLEHNALPIGENAYDSYQFFGTSLFHVFFQYISGYNEALMYVSGSLLVFLGFLLPIGTLRVSEDKGERFRQYGKVIVYVILLWFGSYILYTYGIKNLYTDMPVIAWAGGLAGWWMNRDRGRGSRNTALKNLCILIPGLLLIYSMKTQSGALLALFVVLWALVWTLFGEGRYDEFSKESKRKFWQCIGVILAVGVLLLILCVAVPALREQFFTGHAGAEYSASKAKQTAAVFITAVFGKALSGGGTISLTLLSGLALCLLLFGAAAEMSGKSLQEKRRERIVTVGYSVVMTFGYLVMLLYAYCFIFSYEESIKVAGIARYFSALVLYLLVIALTMLLRIWFGSALQGEANRIVAGSGAVVNGASNAAAASTAANSRTAAVSYNRYVRYWFLGLTVFFLLGVDEKFIPTMTGIDKSHSGTYEELHSAREQSRQIKEIIGDEDKVYMLNQSGKTEYPVNMAYYQLENQVSNYLVLPWKFTANGAYVRVKETDAYSLENFNILLTGGGYTYVWIYATDKYLTRNLPEVMEMDAAPADASLYKVVVDETGAVSLSFVTTLEVTY